MYAENIFSLYMYKISIILTQLISSSIELKQYFNYNKLLELHTYMVS